MTHPNNIQLAIELNNQAAALIGNGQFKFSISALTSALEASKNELSDFSDDEDKYWAPPMMKQTSLDECMLAESSSVEDEQEESNDDEVDQGYYVYNRAIHIPVSSIEEEEETSHHSRVMVSIVTIFNLALAHHLAAMEENSVFRSQLLRKAVKLYELAHNLQREEESMENTLLFTMAIINNLGLIYRCLDESEISGKCFQQLLSTLMFLTDCGSENQRDVPAFAGFFRNTSHLIFHLSSAAAA
jgi:tetratricopeptide (TPR) repeat protein